MTCGAELCVLLFFRIAGMLSDSLYFLICIIEKARLSMLDDDSYFWQVPAKRVPIKEKIVSNTRF